MKKYIKLKINILIKKSKDFLILKVKKIKEFQSVIFKKIKIFLCKLRVKTIGFNNYTFFLKRNFLDKPIYRIIIYIILVFIAKLISDFLIKLDIGNTPDGLSGIATSIGSVIGGSIAIIFTISTFILQNTAEYFSTQYLNNFIENKSERRVFLILVILSISSFSISFIPDSNIRGILFTFLIFSLLCSFYLIYILYKDSRKMINPETTLIKIRDKAIDDLRKTKKAFSLSAKIQDLTHSYDSNGKNMLMDTQYRVYSLWKENILIHVKQLFEISLRLLSKNEIESTKLAIKYIHDIYKEHLDLRSDNFVKIPANMLSMVYTFDDQGFTTSILEYFESYGNRIIQENRKENIYHFLSIYQSIFEHSLKIDFSKTKSFNSDNPIATMILGYYSNYVETIISTKDINYVWEMIKITENMQRNILSIKNDHFLLETIDRIFEKTSIYLYNNKNSQTNTFIEKILEIYLNTIIISWNKYPHDTIFWKRIFEKFEKHLTIYLSNIEPLDLSLSNALINFRSWQINTINSIFEIENKEKKNDQLEKYIIFIKNWSNFLLSFSRNYGINNNPLALQIIMSVEDNTKVINSIEDRSGKKLDELYRTQFSILSWYFDKTETIEKDYSIELENLLRFLIWEILVNLKNKIKLELNTNIINLYVDIIENLFNKTKDTYGFGLPRATSKLIPLGVILNKYKHKSEQKIIDKINELNNKYLEKNKKAWEEEIKQFGKKVSRPDEYELCLEISDMGDEIFSSSHVRSDIKEILNKNITRKEWDNFISKISYCKDIKYTKTTGIL